MTQYLIGDDVYVFIQRHELSQDKIVNATVINITDADEIVVRVLGTSKVKRFDAETGFEVGSNDDAFRKYIKPQNEKTDRLYLDYRWTTERDFMVARIKKFDVADMSGEKLIGLFQYYVSFVFE